MTELSETPWHDDDAFWACYEPVMFGPRAWEGAVLEIDRVVERLQLEPGASVLDLCCGPGRHSLELARRGFQVTAVDRTARYLDQLREAAAREELDIDIVQADMRSFERAASFDVALSLYTSFGYFDDAANHEVLRHLSASLVEGGRLVMEMMGKEVLARIFRPRDWREIAPGLILLEEREIQPGWQRIRNCWTLLDAQQRVATTFDHRLYSARELGDELVEAGFAEVEVLGSFAGAAYDHEAQRLVVVATR